MARIFIHIGHYKTGTTALQAWCAEHEAALAARGLLYPRSGRGASAPTNHAGLSMPIAVKHGFNPPIWYQDGFDPNQLFADLAGEIAARKPRKILISSEEFIQLALTTDPERALRSLKNRLKGRIRIIFTAREPFALLMSWYAQVNRGVRARATWLQFLLNLSPDFAAQSPIVDRFAEVFGPRRIRVLSHGPDLLSQLLGATRTKGFRGHSLPRINASDDHDSLEARRYAKMTPEDSDLAVSRLDSLAPLTARLDMINRGYDALRQKQRRLPPSRLTLDAVLDHYLTLLGPAAKTTRLDPREAATLRHLASTAPSRAADRLARAAALIDASQSPGKPPA